MTQKKQNNIPLIAGILFAIHAIYLVSNFRYAVSLLAILNVAGVAAICFSLFTKRRDVVICAGFAVLALMSLIGAVKTPYLAIFNWLATLGYIGATLICIGELTDYIPQLKEIGKKIWFVPAIFGGLSIPKLFFHYFSFISFVQIILDVAAVLLSMMWVVYPDRVPNTSKPTANNAVGNNSTSAPVAADGMYYELIKHILLLLFTFGIWFLIWIYRVTGYTNNVKDEEERNPTTKLLLCIFVPFYQVYWSYKTAQRIDKMAAANGLQSDLSTLCLILAIFVPIIPPILMQDKLNNIAVAGDVKTAPTREPHTADSTVLGTAEELKNYKELLDSGVITQEEFDAKKKQLLGL